MRKREYHIDFALWSERQAEALRQRAGNEIDWENVAEEIESFGRSDNRENPQLAHSDLRAFAQVALPDRCAFERLAQLDRHGVR